MLFLGREVLLVNKAVMDRTKKHGGGNSELPKDEQLSAESSPDGHRDRHQQVTVVTIE